MLTMFLARAQLLDNNNQVAVSNKCKIVKIQKFEISY